MSGKHIAEHAFVRFDSVGNRYVCVFFFPGQTIHAIYDVCTVLFWGGPEQACYTLFAMWKNLNVNLEFIDKELHLSNTYYTSPLV